MSTSSLPKKTRSCTFRLDLTKPNDQEIDALVSRLKKKRQFTQAAREGVRLWGSLKQFDLDVLDQQFPWVRTLLNQEYEAKMKEKRAAAHQDKLEKLVEELEELVRIAKRAAAAAPAAAPARVAPTSMSGSTTGRPEEGIELTVEKAELPYGQANLNFIRNMLALANDTGPYGSEEEQKTKVRRRTKPKTEIEIKAVPASEEPETTPETTPEAAPEPSQEPVQKPVQRPVTIKRTPGSDVQLPPPNLDDITL